MVIDTGEAVVVVVGLADDVGRIATAGELVDWLVDVVDVVDERREELVTVEVVEVVAVEVDVDVRGMGEGGLDVVDEMELEDVEELVGDSVTVGWTVEITVVPTTPKQVEN